MANTNRSTIYDLTKAVEKCNSIMASNLLHEGVVEEGEDLPQLDSSVRISIETTVGWIYEKMCLLLKMETAKWAYIELLSPLKNLWKDMQEEEKLQPRFSNQPHHLWDISFQEAKKLLPALKDEYPRKKNGEYLVFLGTLSSLCFLGLIYALNEKSIEELA